LRRRATQNSALSSASTTKKNLAETPYISSNPIKSRSKHLSAPSGSYSKINSGATPPKKQQPIFIQHQPSESVQAHLLAVGLNIDAQIIEKSIDFNQDLHLGENNKLHINKAGIQKILLLLGEMKGVTTLDFRQCRIQPEGLIFLAKNVSVLKDLNKIYLPQYLTKEALASLKDLQQEAEHLDLIFAESEVDSND
jgi:hypothetical protein